MPGSTHRASHASGASLPTEIGTKASGAAKVRADRTTTGPDLDIKVFVHLAFGFDARVWRQRWESGELMGVNEPTPYGYGRAAERLASLEYSKDHSEGKLGKLLRLSLRAFLGFDLLHAYNNRLAVRLCDVVWTHTESQFLAIALLKKLGLVGRPALLGQSVWLFDRWDTTNRARRALYSWLIDEVEVLTVHSPENLTVARTLFPAKRCELVLFGIATDCMREPELQPRSEPLRVVAVGNDRHRDWLTAVHAVNGLTGVHLTIVSGTAPTAVADAVPNAVLRKVRSNKELNAIFAESNIVLVPLHRNLHASGITVLQEAAVNGLPAIASDTGGLYVYFTSDEVAYVPVGDVGALRETLVALRDDPHRRHSMAQRAQARMGPAGLSSCAFIERHLEISQSLASLGRQGDAR